MLITKTMLESFKYPTELFPKRIFKNSLHYKCHRAFWYICNINFDAVIISILILLFQLVAMKYAVLFCFVSISLLIINSIIIRVLVPRNNNVEEDTHVGNNHEHGRYANSDDYDSYTGD